jgi:hypothetical protein
MAEKESPFSDVPKDHWAAVSVDTLAKAGILKGYPDKTFKGDQCVTRYELAAALSGLAQFFEESRKPLIEKTQPAKTQKSDEKLRRKNSVDWLIANEYLPKTTILAKQPRSTVKSSEMADAMAAVVARMCELDAKANPPKPLPSDKDWETK